MEKRVWLQSAAACGRMPWNGKEEKITGTGCNHHEMMVATEKRDPVNIVFYLIKVISAMFLDSVRTPRFPKIRKIPTRFKEQERNQEPRTPEIPSLSIPFIVHNFISNAWVLVIFDITV